MLAKARSGATVSRQRRAGVESEPAHPQQRSACDREREVVREDRIGAVALALAQHDHAGETGDTGIDVHHGAAARSRVRRSDASQPSGDHTQCAIGTYTHNDHSAMNTSIEENLMRSANAPVISAGVMMANIIWNIMKTDSGNGRREVADRDLGPPFA